MKRPRVLVLTGYGLNCDIETAYAFELAGGVSERVHINALIDRSVSLDAFEILVFGGGFSWGDDHGAGVVQAVRMGTHLGDAIRRFIEAGNLVIGICNGFQTLVNMGLLPGFDGYYGRREVALLHNDCGNFRDQWVRLSIEADSACIWTRGIDRIDLPVRHGEGKFYAEADVMAALARNHQIVCRYALADGGPADGAFPENPNGSLADIAGICDGTGRVFGLMPHPEAFHHPTHHPDWTRTREFRKRGLAVDETIDVMGTRIFENAIRYFKS